jgi:hypothetical protein
MRSDEAVALGRDYYSSLTISRPDRDGFVQFILRYWRPHGILLDIGTGMGSILSGLSKRNSSIIPIGLDHSLSLLCVRPSRTLGIQADASIGLPFSNTSVDAVILSAILHLVADPLELEADISRRYLNRFAPRLATLDRKRYPKLMSLKLALAALGAPVRAVDNVHLGHFRLSNEFLSSLRARPWSTLGLLSAQERQHLFHGLEERICSIESCGSVRPRLPVMRTGLMAIKS